MKWLSLFLIMGCAQVTSLNLKKHQFGILPTKIIWFQIAGLEEEQIAMLRFQDSGETRTSFENNACIGKTWSYNLYELRTRAESTFLSQITGKKNIKLNCDDVDNRPIWSYLAVNGYVTGIYEIAANQKQSLVSLNQCGEKGVVFLSSLYFWLKKEPTNGAQTYHYTEKIPFMANQIFYDKTCQTKSCGSSITEDLTAIYPKFEKIAHKNMFIVRDFSYLEALEKKDFVRARHILGDLERAYQLALNSVEKNSDHLVLLTTGDSRFVDLPDQGKQWFEFEKNGSNAQVKRTKLTNLVLASGARSENFCGMYESTQIFERILTGPKQQGLELMLINPFK